MEDPSLELPPSSSRGCGEIGIHAAFRSPWGQPRGGSSPLSRTTHTHQANSNRVALDAALHCLTGCAIGEIAGMVIATAAGLSNASSIALSIVLAFVFGYTLTSLPLLRAGL